MKTRPPIKRLKYFNFLLPLALGFSLVCPDFQAIAQDSRSAVNITAPTLDDAQKAALLAATSSTYRIDKARDEFRHPAQTLEFFGIKPSDSVIEVWPGQGWYSTILGAYLKSGNGKLIAAHFDTTTSSSNLVRQIVDGYKVRFVDKPQSFGDVSIVGFGPRSQALGPENSADAVLTFRNIHNWMAQGWAEKAFDDFYKVLKPGGILGIEEHRGDNNSPQDPLANDGYVREDFVIDMALEAGFVLVASSEINANPKDTKDHPFGVWTLPPVSRTSPQGQPNNPAFDKRIYDAIGESDRMTLVFRKPLLPPPTVIARNTPQASAPFPVRVVLAEPANGRTATATSNARTTPSSRTPSPNIISPTIIPANTAAAAPDPIVAAPIVNNAPPTSPPVTVPVVVPVVAPPINEPPPPPPILPSVNQTTNSEPTITTPWIDPAPPTPPPPAPETAPPDLPHFNVPSWQVREAPPPPPPSVIAPPSPVPTATPTTRTGANPTQTTARTTARTAAPTTAATTTKAKPPAAQTSRSTAARPNATPQTRTSASQTTSRPNPASTSTGRTTSPRPSTTRASTTRPSATRPAAQTTSRGAPPKAEKATTASTRRPNTANSPTARTRTAPAPTPKAKAKAAPSNVPSWNPPPKKKK